VTGSAIALVVGLGNPGNGYAATRHNAGFQVVDELALRSAAPWRAACRSHVARLGELWLAKPQTYMNRSGDAVEALLEACSVEPQGMLVVVDDIDLPLGRLRLRRDGGPGTHNGLRDIVEVVGTGFPRLRLGVRGADPSGDLAAYVTSPFADDELETAAALWRRGADAVELILARGVDEAMNTVNRRPRPAEDAEAQSSSA
jgi:PTH1 family peptidyl-tRNA hydrolase